MRKAPTVSELFFISTSIRADWREPFGTFSEVEIAASLLGIRGFGGILGVDKERQGSGDRDQQASRGAGHAVGARAIKGEKQIPFGDDKQINENR
jgi:hypothetical protein